MTRLHCLAVVSCFHWAFQRSGEALAISIPIKNPGQEKRKPKQSYKICGLLTMYLTTIPIYIQSKAFPRWWRGFTRVKKQTQLTYGSQQMRSNSDAELKSMVLSSLWKAVPLLGWPRVLSCDPGWFHLLVSLLWHTGQATEGRKLHCDLQVQGT